MEIRQRPAESQARARWRPAAEADARPYLLERVGEAAVVQLYADGFNALPAPREAAGVAPGAGGHRRP